MQLIEFLIRNWYVVIILVAVYYQFRKKVARGTRETDRRTPGMPSFGGPSQGALTSRQNNKEASSRSLSSTPDTQQQVLRSQPKSSNGPSSPFPSLNKEEDIKGSAFGQQAIGDLERPHIQPNRQQLAQGILWSEILGPPRAKKPYRK